MCRRIGRAYSPQSLPATKLRVSPWAGIERAFSAASLYHNRLPSSSCLLQLAVQKPSHRYVDLASCLSQRAMAETHYELRPSALLKQIYLLKSNRLKRSSMAGLLTGTY